MKRIIKVTQAEMLKLAAESASLDQAMTREEYASYEWEKAEREAERRAENAWLHHAESLGWEEAMMEEMIECGLRSRF